MIGSAVARRQLGASARLWAGANGLTTRTGGWDAFSGLRSIDYNVVFTAEPGDDVEARVTRIAEAGVPAVLMVAGAALGEVQRIVAQHWVCIGSTPVMTLGLDGVGDDSAEVGLHEARRLAVDDLAAARALIAEVFEIDDHAARVALPDGVDGRDPQLSAWGAFDEHGGLRSCLALVDVEDSVVVWSMATAPDARGRGYGARALRAGLRGAAASGATRSLLYASAAGEPFYRRLGYDELERWQMWSRPRWVLGRA